MAAETILVNAPNSLIQPGTWPLDYVEQLTAQLRCKPSQVKSYQIISSRLSFGRRKPVSCVVKKNESRRRPELFQDKMDFLLM